MKETFKIGDEVQFDSTKTRFVITYVGTDGKLAGIGADGIAFVDKNPDRWHRTGRYFREALDLMDALRFAKGGD